MHDALKILEDDLKEAKEHLAYHKAHGARGNFEAQIAAYKINWLEKLIRKIKNS